MLVLGQNTVRVYCETAVPVLLMTLCIKWMGISWFTNTLQTEWIHDGSEHQEICLHTQALVMQYQEGGVRQRLGRLIAFSLQSGFLWCFLFQRFGCPAGGTALSSIIFKTTNVYIHRYMHTSSYSKSFCSKPNSINMKKEESTKQGLISLSGLQNHYPQCINSDVRRRTKHFRNICDQ